jgi:UDP-2,3-diacylglucosamine hydrolase
VNGAAAGSAEAGGSLGRLPALFELAAPSGWRAVDFISDLHLCEQMPRTLAAFAAHLRHTSADAVFLLGDLFELWVGDDMRTRPFEQQVVELLADAASRRQLAFMQGNRDFLLGSAMLRDCGLTGLPDPTVFDAWGQRIVLTHGDALCLADRPYQAFRAQVRSAAWQAEFLARPLAERLAIAAQIRHASQTRRQFDGDADADADTATAVQWLHALGAHEMVHGHTHRPGSGPLAPGYKRHVLSDWDLDHGDRAEVLRLTREGFTRIAPAGG